MNDRSLIPLARDLSLSVFAEMRVTTISGFQRPIILHSQEVADLVWVSGGTNDEIAAAWLHDIVEDTSINIGDLKEKFNQNIVEIVGGLTDLREFVDLSLSDRKQKQADRIKNESESVRRIKVADQISNVRALLDPIADMTLDEWDKYLEGAKIIVSECRGVSSLLDDLFLKTYKEGKELIRS